ncbi:MAG: hopanoid biosynthesis-associated protein HpnK [Rhodospirillales bacterium]|nr:hopanoid biosynthesis-associated protein HpnK [Rhodospirillales bacterium]
MAADCGTVPPGSRPPAAASARRRVIFCADDFGLSPAVNEAVERAHREGILGAASLMVAAPEAADAVRRARALPALRVGLHLVVIEGPAVLPPAAIPDLVDTAGQFPSDQLRLGLRYAFHPRVRRQLAAEIRAQFAAFAATGLALDHADAHKHMHLHPTVGRLMCDIGQEFGLRAIRVPAEPPAVLHAAGVRTGFGDRALYRWSGLLRAQARRAGMTVPDHCFGIAWSGHMTATRMRSLAPLLPNGLSEVYFHPASRQDAPLAKLMPRYEHVAELDALCDPEVAAAFAAAGARQVTYTEETTRCR